MLWAAAGPGESEAFTILQGGGGPGNIIGWNYEKFLVNASGWPVKRYPAGISPMVAEMDVRELLNASHAGQTAALVVASS